MGVSGWSVQIAVLTPWRWRMAGVSRDWLASSGLERSPRQGDHARPLLRQKIRDQVPLCAVDDHIAQVELLADPDPGNDVIRPVGVDVDRELPPEDGEQRLQLGVIVRLLLLLILQGPLQLLPVLLRLGQILPDHRGGGHAGCGGLPALVVGELGVLPQGQLHGRRSLKHHGVHPAAVGLDGGKLAADGIGAARAGENGGHSGLPGLLKAAVHGVDGVHRPQVGGAGIGGLIAVIPLHAHRVPEHPQMAVGVHKAGLDMPALGVKQLALPLLGTLLHGTEAGDLVPPDLHIAPGDGKALHGVDRSVDDQHFVSFPGKAGSDKTFR